MLKYDNDNMYKIDINEKLDKRKLIVTILLILVLILLVIIAKNSIEIIKYDKIYMQYEQQIAALQVEKANEEAKLKEEQEKLKRERNPQLTEIRQRKYNPYI